MTIFDAYLRTAYTDALPAFLTAALHTHSFVFWGVKCMSLLLDRHAASHNRGSVFALAMAPLTTSDLQMKASGVGGVNDKKAL